MSRYGNERHEDEKGGSPAPAYESNSSGTRDRLIQCFGKAVFVDAFLVLFIVESVLLLPVLGITAKYYHSALKAIYYATGDEWLGGKALAALILLVVACIWTIIVIILILSDVLTNENWRKKVLATMTFIDLVIAAVFGYTIVYYGPAFQWVTCNDLHDNTYNTNRFRQGDFSLAAWMTTTTGHCRLGKAAIGLSGAEMAFFSITAGILVVLLLLAPKRESTRAGNERQPIV